MVLEPFIAANFFGFHVPTERGLVNVVDSCVESLGSYGLLLALNILNSTCDKGVLPFSDLLTYLSGFGSGVCQGQSAKPKIVTLLLKTETEKPSSAVSYYTKVEAVAVKILALWEGFNLVGAKSVDEHFLSLFLSLFRCINLAEKL